MKAITALTSLATCLGLAGGGHADVLISYDNSTTHVEADTNFRSTATSSGTGPYVDTNAFDDQTPLSPATGYTGPVFYGGYQFTSSTIDAGFAREQVRNDYQNPSADQIFLQAYNFTGWAGSTLSLHGVYLFKQADFNPGHETGAINLDGLSMEWTGFGNTTDASLDLIGRFVIQVEGTYYLSETAIDMTNVNGDISVSGAQLADEQWAVYDPDAALDFDADNAAYNPLSLTGVTAVGIYFEEDGWTGATATSAVGVGIKSFQATGNVVPEPSTMGVWGAGCFACFFRRRARSRRKGS